MTPASSFEEKTKAWTTKQVVFLTLFVVCVFLIFWLLYELRVVAFLFLVAIVIGTAVRPGVEWLHRRGIPRTTGVMLIYIFAAGLLTGFLALFLPLIADQATQLSQNLPVYYGDVRSYLISSDNRLLQFIGWRVPVRPEFLGQADVSVAEVLDQVTQTVFYINTAVKGFLGVLAVFLLAYYWTHESRHIARSILRIIPRVHRKDFADFFRLAELKIGGYVRGQGTLALLVGLAAFIVYVLLGLPFSLILAIIAGITEMIPIIGPALGAIPAMVVALSAQPDKAVWVVAGTALIQLLESGLLVPRVMKSSMGVNPIVVLLSLVAFSSVLGFPGAVLALPLAAIIQLVIDRFLLASDDTKSSAVQLQLVNGAGLPSLLEQSRELAERIQTTSANGNGSFRALPESDRTEFEVLARELGQLLEEIKREDEVLS